MQVQRRKPEAPKLPKPMTPRTPKPAPRAVKDGFAVNSKKVAAPATAATKQSISERINDVSKAVNAWSGYAGSVGAYASAGVDRKLASTTAGMKNLTRTFNSLAAEKAVVGRGYQTSIKQMQSLLKNPVVLKDADLTRRIKNQLTSTVDIAKTHLAKYDKPLGTMKSMFKENKAVFDKLDDVSKKLAKTGQALSALGAVTNGLSAGLDSAAETKLGKLVDGVTAGSLNYFFGAAIGTTPVGMAVGALDAFTGNNLSNTLNSLSTTVATMGEYVATGSTKGLQDLAEKQRKGDFGFIIQGANAAGTALTTLGNPQKMQEFADSMARGDGGPIGRFGNALGEGLFGLYRAAGGR